MSFDAMLTRIDIAQHIGAIFRSRPGQNSNGTAAEWWAVDITLSSGETVLGATVVGPTLPRVGQKVMVGWFGGNRSKTGWAIPLEWFNAAGLIGKEHVLDLSAVEHYVTPAGRVVWESKGEGRQPILELTPAGVDDLPTAAISGGGNNIARVGDYTRVDEETSPSFVAWMVKVTAALNAIRTAPNGDAIPALVSAALGGVALAMPSDPVPEVAGQEAAVGVAVGLVATGSPWATTR